MFWFLSDCPKNIASSSIMTADIRLSMMVSTCFHPLSLCEMSKFFAVAILLLSFSAVTVRSNWTVFSQWKRKQKGVKKRNRRVTYDWGGLILFFNLYLTSCQYSICLVFILRVYPGGWKMTRVQAWLSKSWIALPLYLWKLSESDHIQALQWLQQVENPKNSTSWVLDKKSL